MMKLFVCGSRKITDKNWIFSILDDFVGTNTDEIEILEGEAQGVDLIAKEWALEHGFKVKEYPPDYEKYHFSATFVRNEQMAQDCSFFRTKQ